MILNWRRVQEDRNMYETNCDIWKCLISSNRRPNGAIRLRNTEHHHRCSPSNSRVSPTNRCLSHYVIRCSRKEWICTVDRKRILIRGKRMSHKLTHGTKSNCTKTLIFNHPISSESGTSTSLSKPLANDPLWQNQKGKRLKLYNNSRDEKPFNPHLMMLFNNPNLVTRRFHKQNRRKSKYLASETRIGKQNTRICKKLDVMLVYLWW